MVVGDLPIFAAQDSADVWTRRELFCLDGRGRPIEVAGVPPDYFSEDGQLWGNPLYDWKAHELEGFAWWAARLRASLRLYDALRIDHFRGFEAYWAVPAGEATARRGVWRKAPGARLFAALRRSLGNEIPIIAEDLGYITDEVKALRDGLGLPGMRILQFAFDESESGEALTAWACRACASCSSPSTSPRAGKPSIRAIPSCRIITSSAASPIRARTTTTRWPAGWPRRARMSASTSSDTWDTREPTVPSPSYGSL
jgi:4-alpha-glucanotransferase